MDNCYALSDYDEYYQDFHDSMRSSEKRMLKHNMRSPQLDTRIKLVQLAKTISSNRLSRTTLHLSIYILDHFMDIFEISPERLQMFVGVCVLLAAKIEDRSDAIPRWAELQQFFGRKIDSREYSIFECMILNSLRWKLVVPTAASFLEYYIFASITVQDVPVSKSPGDQLHVFRQLRLRIYNLIYYLLSLSLDDVHLIGVLPSKMAAATILSARQILNHRPHWTPQLLYITSYELSVVEVLASDLTTLYKYSLDNCPFSPDDLEESAFMPKRRRL